MRNLRIAFFGLLLLVSTHAAAQKDTAWKAVSGDSLVNYAQSFLGTPYVYGACSPKGFDCSGFVHYVFAHFGMEVPRSSVDYLKLGKDVPMAEAKKGDIIVFRGTHRGEERAGHVGIVISNPGEPLRFIHASSSKNHRGVVITEYPTSAYPQRFIRICRVADLN